MADIFLSYAHVDRPRARPIVEMLEDEGWTVWWDRGIAPGMKWLPSLEKELANARAVVVLWTRTSAKSQWVKKEAQSGLDKGSLVPILLDPDAIPGDFSEHQASDLSKWDGTRGLAEIQALLRRMASLVPPSRVDTVRPGYQRRYLGNEHNIPLPGVTGSAAVLRYNHFTIVMNPGRRLAHYVAYNVDGKTLRSIHRDRDRWAADPLLPPSLQMDVGLTRGTGFDRGQLVARATVAWGDERVAGIAARQAFFWPNVAPQDPRLNRWWWLRLEDWERKLAKGRERISGFCGPVFREDDREFGGKIMLEDGLEALDSFRLPRAFWKVVAAASHEHGIEVAAFLMDPAAMQKARAGRIIHVHDYRVSLASLEQKTRLRFDGVLKRARELK